MTSEEILQSKYDRLCVEFKKLRNKHHSLKESTSKDLAELQQLRNKERSEHLQIFDLQQECESLRFRNVQLSAQLQELKEKSHLVHQSGARVSINEDSSSSSKHDDYIENGSASSFNLPDESYAISDNLASCTLAVTPGASVDSAGPSTVSEILKDFTAALRDWSTAILSKNIQSNAPEIHAVLVDRIAQLERQVCELSLQCQLERKRGLMGREQFNSCNSDPSNGNGNRKELDCLVTDRTYENLIIESLQQRVRSLTDQAQYFAGLSAFLQDEIHCITAKVSGLAREAYFYQTEAAKSRILIDKIKDELDQANSTTLRQSNEMAKHIANLTDELQELRGGFGRKNSLDVLNNSSKKVSLSSDSFHYDMLSEMITGNVSGLIRESFAQDYR